MHICLFICTDIAEISADIVLLSSLLEALCRCRRVVGEEGAVNRGERGFQSQPVVHDGTAGTSPFLNISLKWSCVIRKKK